MVHYRFSEEDVKNFSDYLPASKLGEGAFGSVYKGRMVIQGLEQRDIAIKVSNAPTSTEQWDSLWAQWRAETNWLITLQHPNIIELIGSCANRRERKLYLVYEYMAGGTLKQHQSGLDWPGILKVLRGIASALRYIHNYSPSVVNGDFPGLVYGDLKPENILLGQDGEPKISDFGTLTTVQETLRAYTVGYIAPSAQPSGYEAKKEYDVYSFGVVILQLIMKRDDVLRIRREGESLSIKNLVIPHWAEEEVHKKGHAVNQQIIKTGCSISDAIKITNLALYCTNEITQVRQSDEGPNLPDFNEILETLLQLKVQTRFDKLIDFAKNIKSFHHGV